MSPSETRRLTWFWNTAEERTRAGWRLLIQSVAGAAIAFVFVIPIAETLSALHRRGVFLPGAGRRLLDVVINMIVGPLLTAAILFSIWLARRWLDRRTFQGLGWRLDGAWFRDCGFGLALGVALAAALFFTELAAGSLTMAGWWGVTDATVPLPLAFGFSLEKVMCVATYEETWSRGYLLRNLVDGFDGLRGIGRRGARWLAAAASSLVFAAFHLGNPNASFVSTAGLFVNGLLLGVGVLWTGSLGISIGLHVGWNLGQGSIFGFPVSGDKEIASLIAIRQRGSTIITGADFGPEAGMIGIGAAMLGVVAIALYTRGRERLDGAPR